MCPQNKYSKYVCLFTLQARLLGEFHVGAITGAAGLWDGQRIATCSDDGSLRVWSTALSRCIARRTFSSAQTWVLWNPSLSLQSTAAQSEQGCRTACFCGALQCSAMCKYVFSPCNAVSSKLLSWYCSP